MVSVVPRDVTPSPGSAAPVARKAAQPSVVPAYHRRARLEAVGLAGLFGDSADFRAGGMNGGEEVHAKAGPRDPVRPTPRDRVVAGLEGVVLVADGKVAGEVARQPIGLVDDVRNAFDAPCKTRARASGDVAPSAAVSGGARAENPADSAFADGSLYMSAGASGFPDAVDGDGSFRMCHQSKRFRCSVFQFVWKYRTIHDEIADNHA